MQGRNILRLAEGRILVEQLRLPGIVGASVISGILFITLLAWVSTLSNAANVL